MHNLWGYRRDIIGPIKAKENSSLGISGQDVGVMSTKGYEYIPGCKETLTNRESGGVAAKSR